MKLNTAFIISFLFFIFSCKEKAEHEENFVIYQVNPQKQNIQLYWKNHQNEILKSIRNLEKYTASQNEKLVFAMNGGMFEPDYSPKGLYIENNVVIHPADTSKGNGNFYLPPNGIFYITRNHLAEIIETQKFRITPDIKYATQSGPMLVIENKINTAFQSSSKNLNIRNGVGILDNGEIIFAMSKKKVNFYDFASLFKEMGCRNALYLDGFVSRTYLPEKKWIQKDGDLGVMIGVTEPLP
ncbi:MAG: phosphodiester glycosidase family protein [Chryseobacterium sp.]|uniref:phosphodiester glycosidase family protein n=1 Tax=Chryseobacterium sp. TaxID=1871047 RepID=UPI0028310F35|nr:phosphodiester glycosidase family protein [Chryseobacterium sp.]MDR2237881.1 phosphodiester glycosidase family protein [Chryseobacterium sp.]